MTFLPEILESRIAPALISIGLDLLHTNPEAAVGWHGEGTTISGAGDVNHDGIGDFIVGNMGYDGKTGTTPDVGAAYVVFGTANGTLPTIAQLDGTNGFQIVGAHVGGHLGISVSGAGDINGDGFADVIVGAATLDINKSATWGEAYVVFGNASFQASLSVTALDGSNGFTLVGADHPGAIVRGVGDLNGDGLADVAVSGNGGVHVLFGNMSSFAPTLNHSSFTGADGYHLLGVTASSLSTAGDVNHDGFGDLIVGDQNASGSTGTQCGAAYVIYGKATMASNSLNVTALTGTNGFRFLGKKAFEHAGISVAGGGDLNSDGFDDLVIGSAPGLKAPVYVVMGGKLVGQTLTPATLTGANGFVMHGNSFAGFGSSVAMGGDVNGDGFDDFVIGASSGTQGSAFLVHGKAKFSKNVMIDGYGARSMKISGTTGVLGTASLAMSDLNNDGLSDLLIQATDGADSHVVFGTKKAYATISGGKYLEGDTTSTKAKFTVHLLEGNPEPVSLTYATTGVSAVSGIDFVGVAGSLTFAPKSVSKKISVKIVGDLIHERSEELDLVLSEPVNAIVLRASDRATETAVILDNDKGPGSIDISGITANTGATVAGTGVGDAIGRSVRGIGDINGDGFGDFAIAGDRGVMVVFGAANGIANPIPPAQLNGTNGFAVLGADFLPAIAAAGDVNGDGVSDFIVGSALSSSAYVIFGKKAPYLSTLNVTTLSGTGGFKISSVSKSAITAGLGASVAGIGDINSDGFADLLVTAPGGTHAGSAFVIFGKPSGWTNVNVDTLNGTNGFRVTGLGSLDLFGPGTGAGDINGDGYDDFVVQDGNGLHSTVLFGKAAFTATVNLTGLPAGSGFEILAQTRAVVAAVGDVNGDGIDDLAIGEPQSTAGNHSGMVYVIHGSAAFPATVDVTTLNGTNGFAIAGESRGDAFGTAVAAAGDVNGDGVADLVIGAPLSLNAGIASGAGYVIFGKTGTVSATLDSVNLDGATGFRINGGASVAGVGSSVGGAGDFNKDGYSDLLIGAPGATHEKVPNAGEGYLVFGKQIPSFSIADVTVAEGNAGTSRAVFTVTLSIAANSPVTVGFKTVGGTATVGSDFSPVSSTLTFAPGELSKTISIPIVGDRVLEPDETFSVVLSSANGAVISDGVAIGTVRNDDVALPIGPTLVDAHTLKYTDVDGDLVILRVNKGGLDLSDFSFTNSGKGYSLDSINFGNDGNEFAGADLVIKSKQRAHGDGLVRVGMLDAGGIDLNLVKVDGDLARIQAGDGIGATAAIGTLTAKSMGVGHSTLQLSSIAGGIGSLAISGKMQGVRLELSGGEDAGIAEGHIGKIISGNMAGAGILVDGKIGTLNVGSIAGTPTREVTIAAQGNLTPANSAEAVAIDTLHVTHNAAFLDLLAGYDHVGQAKNAQASINSVSVSGSFIASSIVAGVARGVDGKFGTSDDLSIPGGKAIISAIGEIVIGRSVRGTHVNTDRFGIVAREVTSMLIAGKQVPLTPGPSNDTDPIFLSAQKDVVVREVA